MSNKKPATNIKNIATFHYKDGEFNLEKFKKIIEQMYEEHLKREGYILNTNIKTYS